MLPAELQRVDRSQLRAAVGDTTFQRGAQYARQGAVAEMSWRPAKNALYGTVAGSHGERYVTTVYFTGLGAAEPWWFDDAQCTCPVGADCKHAVALVLAAATRAAGDGPARRSAVAPKGWTSSLSALLGDQSVEDEPRSATPLAIELTLSAEISAGRSKRGPGGPSLSVRARLVKPGKTTWVNALSWSKLSSPYGHYQRDDYLATHVQILREMYAVYLSGQEDTAYGAYSHGDDKYLDLGAFASPRLWPLLDEAAAAGVRLVHGRKRLGDIERYGSAELCLDVTRHETSTALNVSPMLRMADPNEAVAPFAFIGDHGVVGIDRAEIQATDRHEDWHIRLARLSAPAPPELIQMAVANKSLRIPAAERPRFVSEFYPGLRRVARIVSSDESFEPPVIEPPTLVARADFGPAHTVEITWE